MKYVPAGARVRIKTDLVPDHDYGENFPMWVNRKMVNYCGRITVVTTCNGHALSLDIDNGDWTWTDEMVEIIEVPDHQYFNLYHGFPIPAQYKDGEFHTEFDGSRFGLENGVRLKVGVPTKGILVSNIYNVGKEGDVVDLVRFDNDYYLDIKYLPMYGYISDTYDVKVVE